MNLLLYIDGKPSGEFVSEAHITAGVQLLPKKDHTYEYAAKRQIPGKQPGTPRKTWVLGKWK